MYSTRAKRQKTLHSAAAIIGSHVVSRESVSHAHCPAVLDACSVQYVGARCREEAPRRATTTRLYLLH
jgi:hypothetical protein